MVDDLQKKRELDRQAALLGLAADKDSGSQGRCLTVLEMSALLDGQCSESERQAFFTHLSSCDYCVREWLELDYIISGKKGRKQRPLLLQPRFLTIGGSMLAAAASLMFFLNFNYDAGPGNVPSPAVPKVQMEITAEKRKSLPAREQAVVPAPASLEEKMERRSLSVQTSGADQGIQAPMKENEEESFSAAAQRTAPALLQSVFPAVDSVQQWSDKVDEGCRNENSGQELWVELARQGAELLDRDQSSGLSVLVRHVKRLVQGEDRVRECMEIQRILAESRKE